MLRQGTSVYPWGRHGTESNLQLLLPLELAIPAAAAVLKAVHQPPLELLLLYVGVLRMVETHQQLQTGGGGQPGGGTHLSAQASELGPGEWVLR
jgi:hypothetical protein